MLFSFSFLLQRFLDQLVTETGDPQSENYKVSTSVYVFHGQKVMYVDFLFIYHLCHTPKESSSGVLSTTECALHVTTD